jgi:hypothetical protein
MIKRISAILFVLAMAGGLRVAMAAGTQGTWKGIVTDKMCATKGVNVTDADCARKCVAAGDSYALYNPADKKVYVLMPADKVAAHAGEQVTIKGSMDGDTITVATVVSAPSKAAN